MSDDPVSVLILAGGRSRRMGLDKVWLRLEGQPLVERAARRVLPLAREVLFSSNSPEPFVTLQGSLGVPARVVADEFQGMGPLAGLHAGLKAAGHDLLLVLAADMPFVDLALLRYMLALAQSHDAVVPRVPRGPSGSLAWEPLHALYRHICLPAVERHLRAGDRRAYGFLPDVRTRAVLGSEIALFEAGMASFLNLSTPADWLQGQRLAGPAG